MQAPLLRIVIQEPSFKAPKHPYTRGLMESIPKFKGEIKTFRTIKGEPPDLCAIPEGCPFNPRCEYAMEICSKENPDLIELEDNDFVACHLYDQRK